MGLVYALLVVAQVIVIALAWQSARAVQRQQQANHRNLLEFAKFGATNFAYRTYSLFANHAVAVSQAVDRQRFVTDRQALRFARRFADSLLTCQCEFAQVVSAHAVMDGAGNVLQALPVNGLPTPISMAALAPLYERIRSFQVPVSVARLVMDQGTPRMVSMSRIGSRRGQAERFLLQLYDADSARRSMFAFIYNTRPTLLPTVFGAQRRNDSVIAVRVVVADRMEFFRSAATSTPSAEVSVPFGPDSTVRVVASLTPAAAREVEDIGGKLQADWIIVATVAATIVICLIALLLHRAAQLARLRGDFTAAVSHELRTPLTEIMLYSELILTGRTSGAEPTNHAARVILAEAKRLYHLVENVLVVARTDRRMLRVRIGRHDVSQVVRDTVDGFEPLASKRGVTVRICAPDGLWALCDPSAVAGILLNLLENAVRYGPEGQTVLVRGSYDGVAAVQVDVDDEGPGIPPSDRHRVFDPYVRLDRDVHASTSGSGLGLAVVSTLINEMRGSIEIRETEEGGASVRVRLPAAPSNDASPQFH